MPISGLPGRYLYICGVVGAVYGASANERLNGAIGEEKGISSRFRVPNFYLVAI